MERKIDDIIQSFREHQFENSLKLILDFEKKKQKKGKKDNTPEDQQILVHILKAASLAKLARNGEAEQVLNTIKLPQKVQSSHFSILLPILRDLNMQQKQKQVISIAQSKKQLAEKQKKGYFVAQYCFMNTKRFAEANKFYFNLYNTSKSANLFFSSIYLQFMDVLNKNNVLVEKKNFLYPVKQGMDFRMIKMFFDKLLGIKPLEQFLKQKVGEQVLKFNIRFLIYLKEYDKAIQLLQKHQNSIRDYWDTLHFFANIYKLNPDKQDAFLRAYLRLFKNNIDLVKYQPALQAYLQYINLLISLGCKEVKINQSHAQLFTLNNQPSQRLSDLLNSLIQEYKQNIASQNQTADYYKFSIKNSLYCIIYILTKCNKTEQAKTYLVQYIKVFSNTLTFAEQLYELTKQPFTLEKPEGFKVDSSIIFDINFQKLQYLWKIAVIPKTVEELIEKTKEFLKYYEQALVKQGVQVLEKGQRYLADEYILILNDIFREFLANTQNNQAVLNIISILQKALKKSPYNFDIKIKLILWYNQLGNPYRLMQIFQTMDIKSSQFEAVAYFIYSPIYFFRLYNEFEQVLLKSIRSHQENEKQIQQYTYNCLQKQSHSTIQEFLSYYSYLRRSYSKTYLTLLLSRFPKFRGGINQKSLLKFALQILKLKVTWSCDAKILRSSINPLRQYCSYYDVFNSSKIMKNELIIRQEQLNLMQQKPSLNNIQQPVKVTLEDILNLEYETVDGVYQYTAVKSIEELQLQKSLKVYELLSQLAHQINVSLRTINQKQYVFKGQSQLTQLLTLSSECSGKHMLLIQQKIADIVLILNRYIDPLNKKKKKLKQDQTNTLNSLTNIKQQCYQIVCSFKPKQQSFSLWIPSEQFVDQWKNIEKQLNNLCSINRRDFQKLFKIQ